MRNRLFGILAMTGFLAAGTVFAAEAPSPSAPTPSTTMGTATDTMPLQTKTGIVKAFDTETHTLTLKDNSSFVLDESLKSDDLKKNQTVTLTFKTEGEKNLVTDYKIITQH